MDHKWCMQWRSIYSIDVCFFEIPMTFTMNGLQSNTGPKCKFSQAPFFTPPNPSSEEKVIPLLAGSLPESLLPQQSWDWRCDHSIQCQYIGEKNHASLPQTNWSGAYLQNIDKLSIKEWISRLSNALLKLLSHKNIESS